MSNPLLNGKVVVVSGGTQGGRREVVTGAVIDWDQNVPGGID